jgi:aminocarboxymuconate-semialdehyde decarboxylase
MKLNSSKAVALLPFQDVPAAVAEIKRAVTQLGLSGVVLSSFGLKEHIGSTTFWPIYEEMERLNVPLMIHASIQGPAGDRRADSFLLQHTVGRPVATLYDCAALIYGGVVEKFPRLRVAFLENRVAWVPYWMDYLDAKWGKAPGDAPLLKENRAPIWQWKLFLLGRASKKKHYRMCLTGSELI